MNRSRIVPAIAVVSLGLVGVLLFRAPSRTAPSRRLMKPSAIRVVRPETLGPIAEPVCLPSKTESVPAPVSEVPEETVVTEVALTPEVAEFGAMLEVSEEVSAKMVELLAARDEAAERILEPYGGELSASVILAVQPRLRMLDEEADRAIESMLTLDRQRRYRELRAEGFIPGTVLDLPPAQLPDEVLDLDSDE